MGVLLISSPKLSVDVYGSTKYNFIDMTLLNKYRPLIAAVDELMPEGVEVMEQNSVLILRGIAPNGEVKNKLWDLYSQIDPNFISREVILDIQVAPSVKGCKAKLIVDSPTLTIRKGPGVELPIIDTLSSDEMVTVLCRANVYWWLIRANDSEGYCYAENIDLYKE